MLPFTECIMDVPHKDATLTHLPIGQLRTLPSVVRTGDVLNSNCRCMGIIGLSFRSEDGGLPIMSIWRQPFFDGRHLPIHLIGLVDVEIYQFLQLDSLL